MSSWFGGSTPAEDSFLTRPDGDIERPPPSRTVELLDLSKRSPGTTLGSEVSPSPASLTRSPSGRKMSQAVLDLNLDLNAIKGPFTEATRKTVIEVLGLFDFDGDGQLEGKEIAKMSDQMAAARNSSGKDGEISIAAFPETVRDAVAKFDLDGSGFVDSGELIAGAKALEQTQKENRYLKIAVVVFIIILIIFCIAIFGLTFAVIKMTEQTEPPSATSPNMLIKGTTEPIRVAATDMTAASGTFRAQTADGGLGGAVSTDTVASFAYLPDLLDMPLEVIISLEELTFMTVDGFMHSFPKQGVGLSLLADGAKKLRFYTSMAGITVDVYATYAELITTDFTKSTTTAVRLVLPSPEDVAARRRHLLSHPDYDLADRCHRTRGVCLHTLKEILHLHGHENVDAHEGRLLESSSSSSGAAFGMIKKDAYSINNDDGFVSWDQTDGGNTVAGGVGTDSTEEVIELEYDEHGCVVEEGFLTESYPLTVKHCYKWRHTSNCEFTISDDLYGLTILSTQASFMDVALDSACDVAKPPTSTGFCECGGGLKLVAGECSPTTPTENFNCAELCMAYATDNNLLTIDLYDASDERLVLPLSFDETTTSDFFGVDPTTNGDFVAGVKPSVYVSARLAYRRESPAFFGALEFPEWLDFFHHVRAHFTADSLSSDGMTWSDESRHGHHATVAGTPLTTKTMTHGGGANFHLDVIAGTTDSHVTFHPDTFPAATYAYYDTASMASCTTDPAACSDFSHILATHFAQDQTFASFLAAGGTTSTSPRAPLDSFVQKCQGAVVTDTSCGKFFDVLYPDFATLEASLDTALDTLFTNMAANLPATTGDFQEYIQCGDLGEECACDGIIRFADATANANSLTHDGFTFHGVTPETTFPAGFSGDWKIASPAAFDGQLAHYYKTSAPATCSAAALVTAIDKENYDDIVLRANGGNALGRDLTKWNCYCKASATVVDQAKFELLGAIDPLTKKVDPTVSSFRDEFLASDWSTYAPFTSGSILSSLTIAELGGLTNPLHTLSTALAHPDLSASCRCRKPASNGLDILSSGEIIETTPAVLAPSATSATIYSIEDADLKRSAHREGQYWTFFHIARYAPASSNHERIFQNANTAPDTVLDVFDLKADEAWCETTVEYKREAFGKGYDWAYCTQPGGGSWLPVPDDDNNFASLEACQDHCTANPDCEHFNHIHTSSQPNRCHFWKGDFADSDCRNVWILHSVYSKQSSSSSSGAYSSLDTCQTACSADLSCNFLAHRASDNHCEFFETCDTVTTNVADSTVYGASSHTQKAPWFDGFNDGKAGVANHHSDYVTESLDIHGEGWVLSTSTQFSYRSNFIDRPLIRASRTENSLLGVALTINDDETISLNSDFEVANLLVLTTPEPLDNAQIIDIESLMYLKYMPLFMRGHYTVEGFHDNKDGDDATWDDEGLFGRHATFTHLGKEGATVVDRGVAGQTISIPKGSSINFPESLLPSNSDFTVFAVTKPVVNSTGYLEPEEGKLLHVSNDGELQKCLDKASPANQWSVVDCQEKGPTITITATEFDKPLVLCEVEALSASVSTATLASNLKAFTNVALERPSASSSVVPMARAGTEFINDFASLRHYIGDGASSAASNSYLETLLLKESSFICNSDSSCYSDTVMLAATCDSPVLATIECENLKDTDACIVDAEQKSAILVAACSTLSFVAITFKNAFEDESDFSSALAAIVLDGGGSYTFTNCRFLGNKAGGMARGAGAIYVGGGGNNLDLQGCEFTNNKWFGTVFTYERVAPHFTTTDLDAQWCEPHHGDLPRSHTVPGRDLQQCKEYCSSLPDCNFFGHRHSDSWCEFWDTCNPAATYAGHSVYQRSGQDGKDDVFIEGLPVAPTHVWDFSTGCSGFNAVVADTGTAAADGIKATAKGGTHCSENMGMRFDGARESLVKLDSWEWGGTFTIEAYFQVDRLKAWQRLFDFGSAGGQGGDNVLFSQHGGNHHWNVYDVGSVESFSYDQWHHMVLSCSGQKNLCTAYIDGESSRETSLSVTQAHRLRKLMRENHFIGNTNWAGNEAFKGTIRYFKMWDDVALSDSDVEYLYSLVPSFPPVSHEWDFSSAGSCDTDGVAPTVVNDYTPVDHGSGTDHAWCHGEPLELGGGGSVYKSVSDCQNKCSSIKDCVYVGHRASDNYCEFYRSCSVHYQGAGHYLYERSVSTNAPPPPVVKYTKNDFGRGYDWAYCINPGGGSWLPVPGGDNNFDSFEACQGHCTANPDCEHFNHIHTASQPNRCTFWKGDLADSDCRDVWSDHSSYSKHTVSPYYTKDGWGAMDFDGETYYLVRRVSGMGRWHRATDNSVGDHEYGAYNPDPIAPRADFSVDYNQYAAGKNHDNFKVLFAKGDMENWVQMTRTQQLAFTSQTNCHNCLNTFAASSSGKTSTRQYMRTSIEDPWISSDNHGVNGCRTHVYAENSGPWWGCAWENAVDGEIDKGHNVWVNDVSLLYKYEVVGQLGGGWCSDRTQVKFYRSRADCETSCSLNPACYAMLFRTDYWCEWVTEAQFASCDTDGYVDVWNWEVPGNNPHTVYRKVAATHTGYPMGPLSAVISDTGFDSNKINGVVIGNTPEATCVEGSGLQLNGVEGFAAFDPWTFGGAMSVEMEVSIKQLRHIQRFFDFSAGDNGNNLVEVVQAADAKFLWYTVASGAHQRTPNQLMDRNTFYHAVITYGEGGKTTFYINGKRVDEYTHSGSYPHELLRQQIYIGKSSYGNKEKSNIDMKFMRVWEHIELSPVQVALAASAASSAVPAPHHEFDFRASCDSPTFPDTGTDSAPGIVAKAINNPTCDVGTGLRLLGGSGGAPNSPSQHIELENLHTGGGVYTLEAFVKVYDETPWARIWDFGDGAADNNILLCFNTQSRLSSYHGYNSDGTSVTSYYNDPIGRTEFHVVWVMSLTHLKMYINGELATATTYTGNPANNKSPVEVRAHSYLGLSNWASDRAFNGEFKYFRSWQGVALNGRQVSSLYSRRDMAWGDYSPQSVSQLMTPPTALSNTVSIGDCVSHMYTGGTGGAAIDIEGSFSGANPNWMEAQNFYSDTHDTFSIFLEHTTGDWFNINEFNAFDSDGNRLIAVSSGSPSFRTHPTALGACYDGDDNTYCATAPRVGEVFLRIDYDINDLHKLHEVKLTNRLDCCANRVLGSIIKVVLNKPTTTAASRDPKNLLWNAHMITIQQDYYSWIPTGPIFGARSFTKCVCTHCEEAEELMDSDSHVANDGKYDSCTMTQVDGETMSWEVELGAGSTVDEIRVVSGSAATSAAFEVRLDGEVVGQTLRRFVNGDDKANQFDVASYKMDTDDFTFVVDDVAVIPSLWIESTNEAGWLEICEVEVYGELSYFEAGGSYNPNVALGRSATSSSTTSTGYGFGGDAVDGDLTTCVKTRTGKFGALRIDLDPGTLPTKVVVHGRSAGDYACEDQKKGLDGATVSIGTPGYAGTAFSEAIHHSCDVGSHTLTSEHDVNELYVVLEAVDLATDLWLCEVSAVVQDLESFENVSDFDLIGRHSFQKLEGMSEVVSATSANDGVFNCSGMANDPINLALGPVSIAIDHYAVVTSLTLDTIGNEGQKLATARLSNGLDLGTFTFDNSGQQSLEVADENLEPQDFTLEYALESVSGDVASFCGTAGSHYVAAEPYLSTLKESSKCGCEAACNAVSLCSVWTFVMSGASPNHKECYLATKSARNTDPIDAIRYVSGGEGVLQGVSEKQLEVPALDPSIPPISHQWEFRTCNGQGDPLDWAAVESLYSDAHDTFSIFYENGDEQYIGLGEFNAYDSEGNRLTPVSSAMSSWYRDDPNYAVTNCYDGNDGTTCHTDSADRGAVGSEQWLRIDYNLNDLHKLHEIKITNRVDCGSGQELNCWLRNVGGSVKVLLNEPATNPNSRQSSYLLWESPTIRNAQKYYSWLPTSPFPEKAIENDPKVDGQAFESNGRGVMKFRGETWYLVRRVAGMGKWFAASDDLVGTAEYGTYYADPNEDGVDWSIPFANSGWDKMLIATGDAEHWIEWSPLQMSQVRSANCHNCYLTPNAMSTGLTSARMYSRHGNGGEDPWLTTADHEQGYHGTAGAVVYAENSTPHMSNRLSASGNNVWVNSRKLEGELVGEEYEDTGNLETKSLATVVGKYKCNEGSGLRFDGTSTYIDFESWSFGGEISFEFLLKFDHFGATPSRLFFFANGADTDKYGVQDSIGGYQYDTRLQAFVRSNLGAGQSCTSASASLGTVGDWKHVVYTFSEDHLKIYLDGSLAHTCDTSTALPVMARSLMYFGKNYGVGNFQGELSYFRMWENTVLTAEHVVTLSNSRALGKSLRIESDDGHAFELAEVVVLDNSLPSALNELISNHFQSQYVYLLGEEEDLKPPVVIVHGGFVIESQGVPWAVGDEWEMYVEEEQMGNLDDVTRSKFGLHPLAHTISGYDPVTKREDFMISDYLFPNCVKTPSPTQYVSDWGFDPVSSEAYSGGLARTKDSYGVEIESLTMCRRMQTAANALRNLEPSTVCGISKWDFENPTCQPTKLTATWTGNGIRFKWLPGCKRADKYQLVRDGVDQIGQDFEKVTTDPDQVIGKTEQKEWCENTWIDGASDLMDTDADLLQDTGKEVQYCIRSMIPLTEGGIVASDWMCATVVIGWYASVSTLITLEKGGGVEEGVIIDTLLCGSDGQASCVDNAKTTDLVHEIGDEGEILAFSAYSTSSELVEYNAEAASACKYRADEKVEKDKPDFVALVDGKEGLAWFAETPGCFLHVTNYEEKGTVLTEDGTFKTAAYFDVVSTGGVQRKDAFLGFAHHIQIKRAPSWLFMAKNCRETCALTGRTVSVRGETFSTPYVKDLKSPEFCSDWQKAGRCPSLAALGQISSTPEGKGAVIFGSDVDDDGYRNIRCSPYKNQFAYFDQEHEEYKCCENFKPSAWDSCSRHWTVCDTSPVTGNVAEFSAPTPDRQFYIKLDTAQPVPVDGLWSGRRSNVPNSGDNPEPGWLPFTVGKDKTDKDGKSVVTLVDLEGTEVREEIKVSNAFVGAIDKFYTTRTDRDGLAAFSLSDGSGGDSLVRTVDVLPFAASEFLLSSNMDFNPLTDEIEGSVNTTVHSFVKTGTAGGSTGAADAESAMTSVISSAGLASFTIADVTSVEVNVFVTHPQVGTGLSCGANGHYMCAFSVDGSMTKYDCDTTDEFGFASLNVPVGVDVDVRNGCPYDWWDRISACSEVTGVKVGRTVEKYEQDVYERRPQIKRVAADSILKGAEQLFVEVNSRFVDVVYGAGRLDFTVEGTGETSELGDDEKMAAERKARANFFMLSNDIQANTQFELTSSERAGCSGMTDLMTLFSEELFDKKADYEENRLFKLPIPRDLVFDLKLSVRDDNLDLQGALDARDYLNNLPAVKLLGTEPSPSGMFFFRTKASMEIVVAEKDDAAELLGCLDLNDDMLYGVAQQNADSNLPTQLDVSVLVTEVYNETQGAVFADATMFLVPGEVKTEDNLAAHTGARQKVHMDYTADKKTKSDLAGKITEDAMEPCLLSTGCALAGPTKMTDTYSVCIPEDADVVKREVLVKNECTIAGKTTRAGSLYQERITALGSPERYTPYQKILRYSFTPSLETHFLPDAAQQAMLATDQEEVAIIVTGLVPLTANQAIKLPEYVPFVILRDPPGDASFSTWHKGSTLSMGLDVSIEDENGNYQSQEMHGGASLAFGKAAAVGLGIGAFVVAGVSDEMFESEIQTGYGEEMFKSTTKRWGGGNAVHFEAGVTYSTSPEYSGVYADLFVTPTLAIRTITNLPIEFNNPEPADPAQCMGKEMGEVSTWQLLDGSSESMSDVLGSEKGYRTRDRQPDYTNTALDVGFAEHSDGLLKGWPDLSKPVLKGLKVEAAEAVADSNWNALAVHTVYDILHGRIPQLQARCFEEWNNLKCNWANDGLSDVRTHFGAAQVHEWCGVVESSNADHDCTFVSATTETSSNLSALRLNACLEGINGWGKALRLNTDLKETAVALGADELVASALFDLPMSFGSVADAEAINFEKYSDAQIQQLADTYWPQVYGKPGPPGLFKDMNDRMNDGHGMTETTNGYGATGSDSMELESWDDTVSKYREYLTGKPDVTLNADFTIDVEYNGGKQGSASIIAFSGGGTETEYSTESGSSKSLSIMFGTDSGLEKTVDVGFDLTAFIMNFGMSATDGVYGGNVIPTLEKEASREEGEEKEITFTLSDGDIGDFFDVKVSRDEVYGTPVFETLAGRSLCPHEPGTDAREAFDVVFPMTENKLDMSGSDVYKKARNIQRPNGAGAGSCASAYVEVVNESPYGDNLELMMELVAGTDSGISLGDNDITGLQLQADGVLMPHLDMLMDDERRRYRITLCPSGGDDRDFVARGERMDAVNADATLDNIHHDKPPQADWNNGYVYCNVGIKVWSVCEYEYWASSFVKGSEYKAGMTMCSTADPKSGTFEESASCWNNVLPEIFDGKSGNADTGYIEEFGANTRFMYEEPLYRMVHIPCLSFDPSGDGCASNPCEGLALED